MPARIGVDIGGTFTDLVVVDEATGAVRVGKVLTTPKDPAQGVEHGVQALLEDARLRPGEVRTVVHGTTLATNALIERKGARTALLTTAGFRDVVEIGREGRYDMYDLFIDPPSPLVPRHLRREVSERLLADGAVLRPLDEDAARAEIRRLAGEGARDLPPARLRQSRPRAASGGDRAGGGAGPGRLLLVRRRPGDSRVRARLDDHRQRVRGAAHGALPRGPGAPPDRARRPGSALRHAVVRRHRAPAPRPPASHQAR